MFTFKNIYDIVLKIIKFFNAKDYMFKVCRKCNIKKELQYYGSQRAICNDCCNLIRRSKYPKSVCRQCKLEFRPGVEGRYKFCTEICRFMNKVKKDESSGCWIWQAGIHKDGYGNFAPIGGRSGLAHRSSYRIFRGPIEKDKLVLHSCNNPPCVNPDHLRLGTDKENALDKIMAGNSHNIPKGESSHYSKLLEEDIMNIRKKHAEGFSYVSISKNYEVTAETISNIVRRITWKHI